MPLPETPTGLSVTEDIDILLGRAHDALDTGDWRGADRLLAQVTAGVPTSAEAWGAWGQALQGLERMDEAIAAYARAAALEPGRTLWSLRQATLLLDGGAVTAAGALVTDMLARRADDAATHRLAARLCLARGERENALRHAREARFLAPHDLGRAVEVAEVMVAAGDPLAATELLQPLLAHAHPADPARAPALVLAGRAWAALSEVGKAVRCWREALTVDPDDAGGATRALAAVEASAEEASQTLTSPYVKALFDRYADRFDADLTVKLRYQAPELLRRALEQVGAGPNLDVLDIGCGTGLGGAAVRSLARHLAGVDLSPRMVERARARCVYDRLWDGDLMDALAAAPAAWDLVLAADVLVYLGDLAPVFQAAAALRAGGRFAGTVEQWLGAGGYTLRESRRYAHARSHLEGAAAAAGLDIELLDPIAPRWEGGRPVDGLLFILRRSG